MISDIRKAFDDADDKFLSYDHSANVDPIIEALTILNRLDPDKRSISGADHDIIFFEARPEVLEQNATQEDIEELVKYGVFLSQEYDCLAKFV